MKTSTVTFNEPVKRGDTLIGGVELRKPNAGELRGLEMRSLLMGDVTQHLKLLPRITLPILVEQELEKMDADDFSALVNEAVVFLLPKEAKSQLSTSTN